MWFPFPLQGCVNGHEWLARRLDRHGMAYRKREDVFVHVSDLERAQQLADGFASVDWVRVLGCYARQVNPLLRDLLAPMQYYWVTAPGARRLPARRPLRASAEPRRS